MKLRMDESSVRLRLKRSEVERFGAEQAVESVIRFPAGRSLSTRLVAGEAVSLSVSFDGDRIEVAVPAAQAREWVEGSGVGLYGKHGDVEIVVEKDFRRTTARSADDGDRYPNPRSPKA